jgi:hypothetical protein
MLGGKSSALSSNDFGGTKVNEFDDSVMVQQDVLILLVCVHGKAQG